MGSSCHPWPHRRKAFYAGTMASGEQPATGSGHEPGPLLATARHSGPTGWLRVRRVINVVNLATPLGLLVAVAGGGRIERGPHGLLLARDYRARVPAPRAPAVTIGDVVLLRAGDAELARRPALLAHEARHATQYAFWLGPLGFLPAYLLASAWSWYRTGNFALGNPFEVRAGLADGGYRTR